MPVIKVYQHGLTAGIPPMKNDHPRAKRGNVIGWTDKATRSNVAFLRSVYLPELHGLGFAVTLTLRDCPASSEDWHKLRRSFIKRMERAGLLRAHWVTEWQRRGVPHLHGAIYFPEPADTSEYIRYHSAIEQHWLAVSDRYGAQRWAQHVKPITDAVGWFQYVAKHAARGVRHYQRSSENMPTGWKKTGRVWGYVGDWPTRDAMRIELTQAGYWRFRRIVRAWRTADARLSGDTYRIRQAKTMLQDTDRARCEVRGVSEWMPQSLTLTVLDHLAASGYSIVN